MLHVNAGSVALRRFRASYINAQASTHAEEALWRFRDVMLNQDPIGNIHSVSYKFNQLLQADYLWRYYYEIYSIHILSVLQK
jgi:hypothetical protein